MEHKMLQTLLPKDIYFAFLEMYASRYPHLKIVKGKYPHKRTMPFELHDADRNVVLTYDRWFNVMVVFFTKAREKIIDGKRLTMRGAGTIYPKRIERSFSNRKINWGATNAQPKVWSEAKQKMVPQHRIFFTDPDYCRIHWFKSYRSQYKFQPTNSSKFEKGFKEQFSDALKKNPTIKFKYLYFARTYGTQQE